MNQHRNKNLWTQQNDHTWVRRSSVAIPQSGTSSLATLQQRLRFDANRPLNLGQGDKYITVGKGWPVVGT
jgi:hypothetical protein